MCKSIVNQTTGLYCLLLTAVQCLLLCNDNSNEVKSQKSLIKSRVRSVLLFFLLRCPGWRFFQKSSKGACAPAKYSRVPHEYDTFYTSIQFAIYKKLLYPRRWTPHTIPYLWLAHSTRKNNNQITASKCCVYQGCCVLCSVFRVPPQRTTFFFQHINTASERHRQLLHTTLYSILKITELLLQLFCCRIVSYDTYSTAVEMYYNTVCRIPYASDIPQAGFAPKPPSSKLHV